MSHKHSSTLRASPDISQKRLFPSSVHLLRDSTTDQSGIPRLKPILNSVKTMHPASRGGNSVKTLLGGVLSNADV